ncbi:polyprotein [megrivirus E1]|uniref:Genome polyprotein n=1 Tax=megrivirus E1 TaxID=2079598 RepID=A0A2K9YRJ1_9PICO|nr:polyprotein [megrivirus E1]AUW36413.1 polyprotein [megrivirus E1]
MDSRLTFLQDFLKEHGASLSDWERRVIEREIEITKKRKFEEETEMVVKELIKSVDAVFAPLDANVFKFEAPDPELNEILDKMLKDLPLVLTQKDLEMFQEVISRYRFEADITTKFDNPSQIVVKNLAFKFESPMQPHKPEDNTPLQAQQEDMCEEKNFGSAATAETSIRAVTQPQGRSRSNWTIETHAGASLRLWIAGADWTSSATTGTALNFSLFQANGPAAGPLLLPLALVRNTSAIDVGGSDTSIIGTNQFSQMYVTHALYSTGYDVFVTLNGTQFHSGSLLVVAVPAPHVLQKPLSNQLPSANKSIAIGDLYNIVQAGIFPSGRLMPRSNSELHLSLPYVHHSPMKQTVTGEVDYAIYVIVESQLGVPTGTAPTLRVNIEVQPKNPIFAASKRPQNTFAFGQVNITTLPTPPVPASFEMQSRDIPGVGAIASARSGALQTVTFGKPAPELFFLPPRTEDFRSLLARPTIKTLIKVQNSYSTGTLIAEWDVGPLGDLRDPGGAVKVQEGESFLSTFSRYFVQWRGSINYTLEWVGPAVSSGRILLAYQPGAAREHKTGEQGPQVPAGNVLNALTTGPHLVWDLSNSTSVTFTADYALDTDWANVRRMMAAGSGNTASSDYGGVGSKGISGTMYLAMITNVVTPQTTQQAFDIVLHESAGPDFSLRYFSPIASNTYPIFNGVLDQGPPDAVHIPGSTELDEFPLSVERIMNHPRLLANGSFTRNQVLKLPLSLITFSTGTTVNDNQVRIAPARIFPALFTYLKADLRIIVTTSSTSNLIVAYRPPGIPDTPFGDVPLSANSLTNANWTILSTRADNTGFELFVPFPSNQSAFGTSISTLNRSDVVYNPAQDQYNPGYLGTVLVVSRDIDQATVTQQSVSVFVGFENVSAHVPRPFGPIIARIAQPTMLAQEVDDFGEEPLELAEFESPTPSPLPRTFFTIEEFKRIWNISDREWDEGITDDGWEIASLLDELDISLEDVVDIPLCLLDLDETLDDEEVAYENLNLLFELPMEYPEGPDYEGIWYFGEFYRMIPSYSPCSSCCWETPYMKAVLVYDPCPRMREYHKFWIITRRIRCEAITYPFKALMKAQREYRRFTMSGYTPRKIVSEYQKAFDFVLHIMQDQFEVSTDSEDSDFFDDDMEGSIYFEAPMEKDVKPKRFCQIATDSDPPILINVPIDTDDEDEAEADDEPPLHPYGEKPFIYYVSRGLYTHWGIAKGNQAISLVQDGMHAKVSFTPEDLPRAQLYKYVNMGAWFSAFCSVGSDFPDYSITNNCTHWTEMMTGEPCSNTGKYLFCSLAACAVAIPFLFHSGRVPCDSAQTTTRGHREHRFRRSIFFSESFSLPRRKPVSAFYEAPMFKINVSNPAVETSANAATLEIKQTLETYRDMAPALSTAITKAACSMQDTSIKASDLLDKLDGLVDSAIDFLPKAVDAATEASQSIVSSLGKKIGSMLLKVIGYCLIIFGNPNPATVAGVISLMASEVLDSKMLRDKIKSVAVSFSHKLQSLFSSLFGVDVCVDDPEIFDNTEFDVLYRQYMEDRVEFESPSQPLQTFNQGVLAMKNVEWIIEKIKDLIGFVIDKLKGKQKSNPEDYVKQRADYIVKLFDDSVETGSCQHVNRGLLDKRLGEANTMLSYCVNNKLHSAAQLLSKTVTNYRTTARKLDASAYEERPEPVVVYIHGAPGVGKSILSNVIARAYCKKFNLPFSSSVFTTPPGSEYFDGYTGQPVHIIDDFCQNTTGEDVKLFCQMVSTVRFSPPMAALEEKGCNYTSRLILATSNLATPQSNEVRIPAALERRCHIKVRTILAPQFQNSSGKLDMAAAFRPCGPAKTSDFKNDCAYLNGAAITCSVYVGTDRTVEKMSVYDLMDLIYEELDRRDQCQDVLKNILFEAPMTPGLQKYYADGVIPTLCNHVDHDSKNCYRVFFRKGDWVDKYDFRTHSELAEFMEGYYKGILPDAKEIRPCPCTNPDCGKLQFFVDGAAKIVDFRSKSAMDFYLFKSGNRHVIFDPEPFSPTVVAPTPKKDVNDLKSEILSLKKKCFISFAITALGTLASVIGAVVYLCKKKKSGVQAAYTGLPPGSKTKKDHPRPIPQRHINYEAPLLPQICNKLSNNVFSMSFNCPGYKPFCISGLGIADRLAVTNHHAMSKAVSVTCRGKTYQRDELKPVQIVRGGRPTDLVFFTFPDGDQFRDITRFFQSTKDKFPRDDVVLVSRSEKMVCNVRATNVRGLKNVSVGDDGEGVNFHNVVAYDCATMPGLCGSPIVSTNPARECILGIHFAGTGATGLCAPIYREDFGPKLEGKIEPIPHPGKPTHVPRKSNLKKSPAYGAFPVTHEPAALTRNDKRLEDGVVLDDVMFSKHSGDHPGWPTLEPAMSYVVTDLMKNLGFSVHDKIEMWTLEQAINGEGVMDGIDMNQSPGYPYNTSGRSRRSFFEWADGKWKPTKELEEAVQHALESPEDFYFTTFLKDELRPRSKVVAGKTRLVDGDSLPRALAYRMVFGPLFERMIAKNGPKIHSAVGCNPDTDWTRYFHEMGPGVYPYCYDLDYSCYDSSEPKISFELMGKYLQPYFSFPIGKYFDALATSKHVYELNAYQMVGGMTSGCVGTSMFNCINNSAFIVSALISMKLSPEDFSWLCYGDDVIISTHEKNLSKRIAEFYHKNTPLVVTPASKSGDFPETSTIYDVTFLKRYFQPDSAYPELIHPFMPLDHLKQSVMWRTDGPFQAKIDSLALLAFHAGGDAYREFVQRVEKACHDRGEDYVFKPFEYLMAAWYANFF